MGEGQFEVMMGRFGALWSAHQRQGWTASGRSGGARCRVKEPTAGAVSRAPPCVIVPSPRSFRSPLPFRFFQRMISVRRGGRGRVVEDESPAGDEEGNSGPSGEEPLARSNRLLWVEDGGRLKLGGV